jgi:hypothetical protein
LDIGRKEKELRIKIEDLRLKIEDLRFKRWGKSIFKSPFRVGE